MATRILYILLVMFTLITSARAEVVVLRSGQRIKGEILLHNDDVVILRKNDGMKYQYPKSEVQQIIHDMDNTSATSSTANLPESKKKIAIQMAIAGGTSYLSYQGWGGMLRADMMVGSHELMGKPIFLGGSIGYRGMYGSSNYSWIPMQIVLQLPIELSSSARHRPVVGSTIGYAIATNKAWKSGMCAGANIGWWYNINHRSSLSLTLTAEWQQTRTHITEIIEEKEYTNFVGCNIIGLGLRMGVQF